MLSDFIITSLITIGVFLMVWASVMMYRAQARNEIKVTGIVTDPVFQRDGKWYFWDETWANEEGPYASESECRTKLIEYAKHLDGK